MTATQDRMNDADYQVIGDVEGFDVGLGERAGKWTPDLHPRDPFGKFASSWQGSLKQPPGPRASSSVDSFLIQHGSSREKLTAQCLTLLDKASPDVTREGKDWYRQGGVLSARIGALHGMDRETAIGVVAAISPRCRWDGELTDEQRHHRGDGNVAIAEKVMAAAADPPETPIRIPAKAFDKIRKGLGQERDTVVPESRRAALVDNPNLTYGDLTPAELGVFHPGVTGTVLPANKARAMQIAKGGNPNDVLGGLKVRSFFDNLTDPDGSEEVTIDSHQIRAMLDDIGLPDSVYGAIAGNPARYLAMADAVRAAAKQRGLKPHQVQAIMWEVWRDEYDLGDRRLANPDNAKRSIDITGGPTVDYDALTAAEADEMIAAGQEAVELVRKATGYSERADWRPDLHPRIPGGHHGGGQFGHTLTATAADGKWPRPPSAKAPAPPRQAPSRYPNQLGNTPYDRDIAQVMDQLTRRFPGAKPPMVVIHPKTQAVFDQRGSQAITTADVYDPKAIATLQNAGLAPNTIFLRPDLLRDESTMAAQLEKANKSHRLVMTKARQPDPGQAAQGLLIHEFGHYLGNQLGTTRKRLAQRRLYEALQQNDGPGPDSGQPARLEDFLHLYDDVSPYATKSPGEAMAELFSQAWYHQQDPQVEEIDWAKDVWATFDKEFGPKEARRDSHPGQPDLGRAGEALRAGEEAARREGHFDPAQHPHAPKGTHIGGQFVHLPGTSGPEAGAPPRPETAPHVARQLDRLHKAGATESLIEMLTQGKSPDDFARQTAALSDEQLQEIVAPARRTPRRPAPTPPKSPAALNFDQTIKTATDDLGERYGLQPEVTVGGNEPFSNASTDAEAPYGVHLDQSMVSSFAQAGLGIEYHEPDRLGYVHHTPQVEATAAEFLRYTLEHEFGHTLTLTAVRYADGKEQTEGGPVNGLLQRMRDILARPESTMDLKEQISLYAMKSEYEAVAEAFAVGRLAQRTGQTMPPISRDVLDTFAQAFPSEGVAERRADFRPELHPRGLHGRWARTTGGRALSTKAYKHAVANGGVTVSTKGVEPHSGYAVALSKNTERKIDLQHFTPAVVKDYMAEHDKELSQPGAHLGIWEQDGDMYLDISYVGPPSKETLLKAQQAQQLAVFDLATMEEIPTGTIKEGRYEPKALDRSVRHPPPGRHPEDPRGAARRADGRRREVPGQTSRTRVGYPGATEALRGAGHWTPDLHPRLPHGHGGGQFVHLPGADPAVRPLLNESRLDPERRYRRQVDPTAIDGVIAEVMTDIHRRYPTAELPPVRVDHVGYAEANKALMFTTPPDDRGHDELVREHLDPSSIYVHPMFTDPYKVHETRMESKPYVVATLPGMPDDNATFARSLLEHEVGHHLANKLDPIDRMDLRGPLARALSQSVFTSALRHPDQVRRLYDELSPYASLDPDEALAEAFAAGLLAQRQGREPNEWSKHVLDVFGRAFADSPYLTDANGLTVAERDPEARVPVAAVRPVDPAASLATVDDFLRGKGRAPSDVEVEHVISAYHLSEPNAAGLRAEVARRRKPKGHLGKTGKVSKSAYEKTLEKLEREGTITPQLQADLDKMRRSASVPIGFPGALRAGHLPGAPWRPELHPRRPNGEFGTGPGLSHQYGEKDPAVGGAIWGFFGGSEPITTAAAYLTDAKGWMQDDSADKETADAARGMLLRIHHAPGSVRPLYSGHAFLARDVRRASDIIDIPLAAASPDARVAAVYGKPQVDSSTPPPVAAPGVHQQDGKVWYKHPDGSWTTPRGNTYPPGHDVAASVEKQFTNPPPGPPTAVVYEFVPGTRALPYGKGERIISGRFTVTHRREETIEQRRVEVITLGDQKPLDVLPDRETVGEYLTHPPDTTGMTDEEAQAAEDDYIYALNQSRRAHLPGTPWNPNLHPRILHGHGGGEFAKKGTSSVPSDDLPPRPHGRLPVEEITTPDKLKPGDRLKIPFGPDMNKIGVVEEIEHDRPSGRPGVIYRLPDAQRPARIVVASDFLVIKTGHGPPLPPPPKPWTPAGQGQNKAEHEGRIHKVDALRKQLGPPEELGKRWEEVPKDSMVEDMKDELKALREDHSDPQHVVQKVRKMRRLEMDISLMEPFGDAKRHLAPDLVADGGPGPETLHKVELIKQAGSLLRRAAHATMEADPATKENRALEQRRAEILARRVEIIREKYDRERQERDELAQRYGYKDTNDLKVQLIDHRDATPWIEMRHLEEQRYDQPPPLEYRQSGEELDQIEDRQSELKGILAEHRRQVAYEMVAAHHRAMGGPLRYKDHPEGGWAPDTRAIAALDNASGFYPADWVDRTRPLHVGIDFRGYHSDDGKIMLSASTELPGDIQYTRVAIHELAHEMEDVVPGLKQAEWAFFWSRTAPGEPGKRSEARPRHMDGYPEWEKAVRDDFHDTYSGKVYNDTAGPDNSWELFSSGMESLMDRGPYLSGADGAGDTDYTNFVFGLLVML